MRWWVRVLLLLSMVVGLLIGSFTLWVASHLHIAAEAGRPAPQSLTLAELADKGPGDNVHVELTDFTFGKPIIEGDGTHWKYVWLPLEPADKAPSSGRPVVLRLGDSPDQARLDQVLAQKKVPALVASSLPGSAWGFRASDTLRQTQPRLATDRSIYLMDNPTVDFAGVVLLSGGMIFDRTWAYVAQVLGWTLIVLGVACAFLLLWSLNRRRVTAARQPAPPDAELLRRRLQDERPVQFHRFRFFGALWRAFLIVLMAVLIFFGSFFGVALMGMLLEKKHPILAGIAGVMALCMFGLVFVVVGLAIRVFTAAAAWIAICPNGLRWRKLGRSRAALWSDIAEFQRYVTISRGGVKTDRLVIVLYSGEFLHFWDLSLTDYERFADRVGIEWHGMGQWTGSVPVRRAVEREVDSHLRQEWTG